MIKHIGECLYEDAWFESCESVVMRGKLAKHESDECYYRMAMCEQCSDEMPYAEYVKHRNNELKCANRRYCPRKCTDSVIVEEYRGEHDSVCPHMLVRCELCPSTTQYKRCDESQHMTDNAVSHVSALQLQLAKVESQLSDILDEPTAHMTIKLNKAVPRREETVPLLLSSTHSA